MPFFLMLTFILYVSVIGIHLSANLVGLSSNLRKVHLCINVLDALSNTWLENKKDAIVSNVEGSVIPTCLYH